MKYLFAGRIGSLIGIGLHVYMTRDVGDKMWQSGILYAANDAYEYTCKSPSHEFWNKVQDAYIKNAERIQNAPIETREDLASLNQILKDPAWPWETVEAK